MVFPMRPQNVSVIIPIYNERRNIICVLKTVLSWNKASEIIIVDDGSTDRVEDVLDIYHHHISYFKLPVNKGKSYAMAVGVRKAQGTYIMFLDGDLVGLNSNHLDGLWEPVRSGVADMTIGTRESKKYGIFWSLHPFGGERVMRREELMPLLPKLHRSGFGAEVLLNEYYRNKKTVYIPMWNVSHMMKFEKYPPHVALYSYLKEFIEVGPRYAWNFFRYGIGKKIRYGHKDSHIED
jgi:glycosyltransferase involved in cell wall biosynthesis